jgi:uncharacterized repeat protein (TIGR02543 family)
LLKVFERVGKTGEDETPRKRRGMKLPVRQIAWSIRKYNFFLIALRATKASAGANAWHKPSLLYVLLYFLFGLAVMFGFSQPISAAVTPHLEIQPGPVINIYYNQIVQLDVLEYMSDGRVAHLRPPLNLSSSNESVAIVDGNILRAVGHGTATISVTYAGMTAQTTVNVSKYVDIFLAKFNQLNFWDQYPTPISAISFESPGLIRSFNVKGKRFDGVIEDVTLLATCTVDDPTQANVSLWSSATMWSLDISSLCWGGSTSLRIEVAGLTEVVPITVANFWTWLEVSPNPVIISPGMSQKLTPMLRGGNTYLDRSGTISQYSSSNPEIATVSNEGIVTGVALGSAVITVTCTDCPGNQYPTKEHHTRQVPVTVNNVVPTSITVEPNLINIPHDGGQTLKVTAVMSDGTTRDVTTSCTYKFNPTGIAAGDYQLEKFMRSTWKDDGTLVIWWETLPVYRLNAVAPGRTDLLVSYMGFNKWIPVTVYMGVQGIIVTPHSLAVQAKGTSRQLTVKAIMADGSYPDVTGHCRFASSNKAVATVSNFGLVTGVAPGTADIWAYYTDQQGIYGEFQAKMTVSVEGITVNPNPLKINRGFTQQLAVTNNLSDGSTYDVTQDCTFTSSNEDVAPVNRFTGLVEGIAAGSATVSVNYQQQTVEVPVTVENISELRANPVNVNHGATWQMVVYAKYGTGGTEVDVTNMCSFSSSDPAIAQVSMKGLVTGVASGSTSIKVKLQGNEIQVPVTVNPVLLNIIANDNTHMTLNQGATRQVRVKANMSDGTTQDVTYSSAFSANSHNVTVSTLGFVTGVQQGTGLVTVSYQGKSTELWVTVTDVVTPKTTLNPTGATFDLDPSGGGYADVPVTMVLNGNTFSYIKNGAVTLTPGEDYTISGDTVTIPKSYLAARSMGPTTLTFYFNQGAATTITDFVIQVADTSLLLNRQNIAMDGDGNRYIAYINHRVVMVPAKSGTYFGRDVTAGIPYIIAGTGTKGYSGDGDAAAQAMLNQPNRLALDTSGNLYINEYGNNIVRMVANKSGTYWGREMTAGHIYTIAGNGINGYTPEGGLAVEAQLSPNGIALDGDDNLYIADSKNHGIRMVAAKSGTYWGREMTAGHIYNIAGFANGHGDGLIATQASLYLPKAVTVDGSGNLYFATNGSCVRMVPADTGVHFGVPMTAGYIYTIAGPRPTSAFTVGSGYAGDGGPGTQALLKFPSALTVDSAGNLYIADKNNYVIRMVAGVTDIQWGIPVTAGYIYTICDRYPYLVDVDLDTAGNPYITENDKETTVPYITLANTASLAKVLNQPIMNGIAAATGTKAAPKTASIEVKEFIDKVTPSNILPVHSSAAIYFYGKDSSFTTLADSVDLVENGETVVYIKVVSEDGLRTSYYKVTIIRKESDDATLATVLNQPIGMGTGAGTWEDKRRVTINVPNSVATVSKSDIVTSHSKAGIWWFGPNWNNKTDSVNLPEGAETIVCICVVAENYYADLYYEVTIKRAAATHTVQFLDYDGNVLKTEIVNDCAGATAPADPQRDGYTFTGWDKDYSYVGSDLTVTAQYSINSYTVSFNTDGGSEIDSQTVNYQEKAVKPADPTKTGWSFGNWYRDEELTIEFDFDTGITSDTTIYAQWIPITLESLSITAPAHKLIYTIGDSLDLSGLVITGIYSDGSTMTETVTADDVSGFDSSKPEANQALTVTIGDKTVTFTIDINATQVHINEIFGVTPPARGGVPVQSIAENEQYTGNVTWYPNDPTFQANTVYEARITLNPKPGYTINCADQSNLKIAEAVSVGIDAASGMITAVFPATKAVPVLREGVAREETANVAVNTPFALNLANIFEDADSDTLTYTVSVNGADEAPADEIYLYTPASTGTTTLVFKAHDETADSSDTYTVTLTADEPTLQYITISALPAKISYTAGETLDISGLEVTGTYSDDSTKTETITEENVSGFDSSVPGTIQVLTVNVDGKTTTYSVIILENLTSGSAQISPAAVVFNLDNPGDVLTNIAWGDAESVIGVVYASDLLEAGDYSVDGYTLTISKEFLCGLSLSDGDTVVLEISFDVGESATLTIEIETLALNSIEITTPANKLSYYVGESLDISGMVVTGTYSDGTTKVESVTAANVTGFDSSAPAASQTLTVTVNGKTTTYTIKIKEITETTYTVTFVDWDGTVLKTETVEEGKGATAPDDPTREGYTFTGWDKDFDHVTSDLTVTAQYSENQTKTYTVTFVDWDGTVLKTETVEEGRGATAPDDPDRDGYIFIGWDANYSKVLSELTVTAQYIEYTPPETDDDRAKQDKEALNIGFAVGDSARSVTHNIILTDTGKVNGSTIIWESDTPDVISNEGIVTRPLFSETDAEVTVTAYVYYNEGKATKEFHLTVLRLEPEKYRVTVSADPPAGGTVSGGGTYPEGSSVTVTASAYNGYTFTNWTEDGEVVSTEASYIFTLGKADRVLKANFTGQSDTFAEISPSTATFDLSAPSDVSTTITWNEAQSVVSVVYYISKSLGGQVYGGTNLTEGIDYGVNGNKLTFYQSFFSSLQLSLEDTVTFDISFDRGEAATLTVETADSMLIDECFIATAAYGSKFTPAVSLLRQFRDKKLLTNEPGRYLVKLYYTYSPAIAKVIAGNEMLKLIVRIALLPIIGLTWLVMHNYAAVTIMHMMLLFYRKAFGKLDWDHRG